MITMDNYEGWLMRYADGELTGAEREAVEAFLGAHPELRDELDVTAAVKVTPPVAVMPGKEWLLHRAAAPVWPRVAAAVAAVCLVAAGLYTLLPSSSPTLASLEPSATHTIPVPETADIPLPEYRSSLSSTAPRKKPAAIMEEELDSIQPRAMAPAECITDVAPEPGEPTTIEVPTEVIALPLYVETDRLAMVKDEPTVMVEMVIETQLTSTPVQTLVRGLLALK